MQKYQFRILVLMTLIFSGCDILKQVEQMSMLSKCEFRLATVQNLTLGGINVQNIHKLSDLRFDQAASLGAELAGGTLPLSLTLNVEAKNPNAMTAALNKLEWILFIDDIEMLQGVTAKRVEISANGGTGVIPLGINVDLKKVLSGKSADAILNFGLNLAGAGNRPTRFMLKAKPTIMAGSQAITYPGYINIKTDFTSQ